MSVSNYAERRGEEQGKPSEKPTTKVFERQIQSEDGSEGMQSQAIASTGSGLAVSDTPMAIISSQSAPGMKTDDRDRAEQRFEETRRCTGRDRADCRGVPAPARARD